MVKKLKKKYDISEEMLNNLLQQFKYQVIPRKIVEISRDNFGFFTERPSRIFEYVWLVKALGRVAGKRILDIGAGISPMPIYFALQGGIVTTIDNSEMVRSWRETKNDWNEWGYLDYGLCYDNIHSINADIEEMDFIKGSFDYIYSISVIEHLPARLRRALWGKFCRWMAEEGLLILTMDYYKGSDYLWNYSYGSMVEFVRKHGNMFSLEEEAGQYFDFKGKKMEEASEVLQDTDVFFYHLTK